MAKPRVVPTGVLSSRPGIDSPAILAVVAEALGTDTALRDALDAANSFLIETDATGTETSLSAAIAASQVDSGWRSITGLAADLTIYLRYKNGVVYGRLFAEDSSDTSLTLPAGWRPQVQHEVMAFNTMDSSSTMVEISTAGILSTPYAGAIGAVKASFSYPVAAAPGDLTPGDPFP